MLKNRNILCVSVPSWKANYASTIVELMKKMGQHNKVLYVQNPYTVKDLLIAILKGDKKFPFRSVLGFSKGVKKYNENGENIHVLTPPLNLTINFLPPGMVYDWLVKLNGWLVRRVVRKSLKKLDMQDELIHMVSFNPVMGVVNARKYGEKLLIYHCYDEIGHAAWMKNHGLRYENKFIRLSDAVIVTSQGLLEKKSNQNKNCYLVKNGADTQLFSTAFNTELPGVKTVGFIGSMDNRLDYELLAYLANHMPDTKFIFIGRIIDESGKKMLEGYSNVLFTGPKTLQELPAFVKDFSAGIIPFVKNEFTKGIYPLKINEYLAAGIPVVSTNFSYLDDFKNVITIADNKELFKEGLINEINTDDLNKRKFRQKVAMANSWDSRAETLSGVIETIESKMSLN